MGILKKITKGFNIGGAAMLGVEIANRVIHNKEVDREAERIEEELSKRMVTLVRETNKELLREVYALKIIVRIVFVGMIILALACVALFVLLLQSSLAV